MKDKCQACNAEGCLTYYIENPKIISCSKCGVLYAEKEYLPEDEYHLAKDNIEPTFITKIWYKVTHHLISKTFAEAYLHYLKLKTKMNFKTAIDIGTGYGHFVDFMCKVGIDAIGIESNQRIAKLSFNKKVRWEYFDQNYHSNAKYDLVCMTLILSFFRDNLSVLKRARDLLTENGLIFLVVPNPQSPLTKSGLPFRPTLANMMFSKKNYQSLENKLGLRLVDYSIYRSNVGLDFRADKNTKISFIKYFLRLKKNFVPDPEGEVAFVLLEPLENHSQ